MNAITRFNQKLALKITNAVSTMWAAYIFAGIALISLPAAIRSGDSLVIVAWIAQTFLQLVLLSIIMVGQAQSAAEVAKIINETHTASISEFEMAKEARAIADKELIELKNMARDIHRVIKDIEGKSSK
jgi:hypothetical protein